MDLALNNLQRLICHKTKQNKQTNKYLNCCITFCWALGQGKRSWCLDIILDFFLAYSFILDLAVGIARTIQCFIVVKLLISTWLLSVCEGRFQLHHSRRPFCLSRTFLLKLFPSYAFHAILLFEEIVCSSAGDWCSTLLSTLYCFLCCQFLPLLFWLLLLL